MEYVAIIQARKAAESKLQTLKEAVKLSNERARKAGSTGQSSDTARQPKGKKEIAR
jgi:hypothetical protein